MDDKLKSRTVLVIDYGMNLPVAERLSRDFGRVLYWTPWQVANPKYHSYVIGVNVPGVERIYNLWDYYDQVDLFYFCHLFMGDFQNWLRKQGKTVFGPGDGEQMEIYRDRMKALQRSVGLPVNHYEVIRGLDGLREYLQDNDNKYIKTNLMRGHFESFHHETYELTEDLLDEWEHTLGIYKNDEVFIVEDPIEAICEIGYDGWVVDGKFPDKAMFGIEVKDCAYCGVVMDYNKLPKALLEINKKLAGTFKEFGYRANYTNEVRLGVDKVDYLIDQTCRHPEPPTCIMLEIFDNYSEIVWDIANGLLPDIKNTYRYGVQLVIKAERAERELQSISFPAQYKNYVKIKNLTVKDGKNYYVPQPGTEMQEIGAVIGLGNTLDEAIEQATMIAKDVKGLSVKCNTDDLAKVQQEIEKMKKAGIRAF